MEKFTVKIAGHYFEIESRYPLIRREFSDYACDLCPTDPIKVAVSEEDTLRTVSKVENISREMAEFAELYRPIAEALPSLGGFVIHGAAISFGGKAFIFTAPSGTGKSTHIRLWHKCLGEDVDIINGDKPIITVEKGEILVHGSPWAGKERWQKNRSLPIGGICLLHRGEECRISPTSFDEILSKLFPQVYIPTEEDSAARVLDLLSAVVEHTPIYSLYCDISEDAVRCAFETLCGESFDTFKKDTGGATK